MIKDKRKRNIVIWSVISGIVAVVGEIIVLFKLELSISGFGGFGLFLLGITGMFAVIFIDRDYYKKKYEESLKKDDTQ